MRVRLLVTIMLAFVALSGVVFAQTEDSTRPAPTGDTTKPTQVEEVKTSPLTVEAELCTGVEERMPMGAADMFSADVGQVCLWSKVLGATDTTFVKHIWYYKGEEKASVELPVRSASWRTWSRKTILPEWTGDWEVKVVDADGRTLAARKFTVTKPVEGTE